MAKKLCRREVQEAVKVKLEDTELREQKTSVEAHIAARDAWSPSR
jgi:hypothetical protein